MFVFLRQSRQVLKVGPVQVEILKRQNGFYLVYCTVHGVQCALHQTGVPEEVSIYWPEVLVESAIQVRLSQIAEQLHQAATELECFQWEGACDS
jgi:hypothetical protein